VLLGAQLPTNVPVTIREAERLIEQWLKEEMESAPLLPYAEKLCDDGYWVLDGRFNVHGLAEKLAQVARIIPFRSGNKEPHLVE
jgi:hypothetical protein